MSRLSTLPDRPLTAAEVAGLNDADALDFAVPVEREDAVRTADEGAVTVSEAVVLAAGDWVAGVVHEADGWRAVETVTLDGEGDRADAMMACEDAIAAARRPGDRAADGLY